MTKNEIDNKADSLRSELVAEAISLFYSGTRYPLSILQSDL